jgi:hypothetical protein
MIVVTCDWDCNKGINNPNGVFSGVTLYNWCSELIKIPNIVQYIFELHLFNYKKACLWFLRMIQLL